VIEPDPAPPAPPRSNRWREAALIGLLALTLNLAGNGRTGLWDRDEPRYATCTREMRQRGDWLRPTFNGQPRYHKPVLIYWLMRAGMALGGDNPFGARLPSAVAGAATCLLAWGLGRAMLGPGAGRLAALMLATAPIVVVESKLATTDATLALFVVAGQYCLWKLTRGASSRWAAGFWVAMALATLTKGPIGPALVAAAGVASWWWGGPTACWRRLRWGSGLAIFAALTVPWYAAIGVASHGAFFRFALTSQQGLGRLASGIEAHGAPPGYYAGLATVLFYPWSALLPAAIFAAWARRKGRPELGFLLGWIVGPWAVLEAVPTKLIHYYLPSFPACALLAAWLIEALAAERANLRQWRLGRAGMVILAGVGGAAALGLAGAGAGILGSRGSLPAALAWPCLAMAPLLGGGMVVAVRRFRAGDSRRAAAGLVATWAALMLIVGGWLMPAAEPLKVSRALGNRLAAVTAQTGATPMVGNFQPPGIIYALGRPAPTIGTLDDLVARVRRRPVAAALLDWEVEEYADEPRLAVEVAETIRGFDMEKGKPQVLRVAVLRPAGPTSTLARRGQQLGVK